jgi:hypothetical protein
MRATFVGLLLLWTAVGCGSSSASPEHAAPPAASQGDETTPDEPTRAAVVEPAAPRATGPGSVTVAAVIDGKNVPAQVRVLDASGAVQAEEAAGAPITLPAGDYRVEVSITDAQAMVDKPTQSRPLTLRAGQNTQLEESFRWAKISMNVISGGRSTPGAVVKLLREGQVVAEFKSGAPPVAVTPGRYEADVLLKGSSVRVKGLQFPAGATQTVPVHAQF